MSVSSGFFNSVNGDRTYDATQMSSLFDGIITDGVFKDYGSHFTVTPSSGMRVNVASGRAWFDHTWTLNDTDYILDIESSTGISWRRDAIVIDVGTTQVVRENRIIVVTGTSYAVTRTGLVNPSLQSNQHPLAYVDVGPDTTAITSDLIQNVVPSVTPYITAPLQSVSASQLYSSWNAEFNEWFLHLQNELDSNQAANLQHQIDQKESKGTWVDVTVSASNWEYSSSTYSFESLYPSRTYDILYVTPNKDTTTRQLNAWIKAKCHGVYDTNVMEAAGTLPFIDINLSLYVRRRS